MRWPWEQFGALDMERLRDLMWVMVDLRNIYRAEDMKKHRFAYTSVGQASTHQPVSVYTRLGEAEILDSNSVRGGDHRSVSVLASL